MVSVAMAVYNGERFLRAQLDSILRQTYQDFEIVICDDCSTDGSVMVIEEYAAKEPRVRLHKNEVNLGYIKNFETAVKLCQGDYVAFCDQDDIWSENHIELLLKAIGDKDLACGRTLRFENDSDITSGNLTDISFHYTPKSEKELFLHSFCDKCIFIGNTMLFTKRFFDDGRLFPFPLAHDYWLGVCAFAAKNGFVQIDDVVTYWRVHKSNVSSPVIARPSFFARMRKILSKEKRQAKAENIPLLREIKTRFNITGERAEYLKLCDDFLEGRVASPFSLFKKARGLPVYIKHYDLIRPFEKTDKVFTYLRRQLFWYIQYLLF